MDSQKQIDMIFLDFSKAFDMVSTLTHKITVLWNQ